jgi:hypothetical protein
MDSEEEEGSGGDDGTEEEEAWDEGIEDLPEVEEAWESVVEDAPEHDAGEELGDRIEYDVSRGGIRRALGWVFAVLFVVLAVALVATIFRSGSDDEDPDPIGARPADSESEPVTVPDDEASDIVIDPIGVAEFTTTLGDVIALESGDEPQGDRIALDIEDSDLPAPRDSVTASLIFFDGRPQVALAGAARWLDTACIQTSVVTTELESVDAAYHDTPTGECGVGGIGRQSQVSCIGDDVIMVDVDLVDAGATSGSERLVADAVRVALVEFPEEFERLSLLGTIALPEDFSITDLPLARAPLGAELTITLPSPAGDIMAPCFTR